MGRGDRKIKSGNNVEWRNEQFSNLTMGSRTSVKVKQIGLFRSLQPRVMLPTWRKATQVLKMSSGKHFSTEGNKSHSLETAGIF